MPLTYNGWNIVTMPSTPASPQDIEFFVVDAVAQNISPFTGQQQIQAWNGTWMECRFTMPPMSHTDATNWVTFVRNLQGAANVFQFPSSFMTAYSESIGTRYWRLKSNKCGWSISKDRVFSFTFEVREAL